MRKTLIFMVFVLSCCSQWEEPSNNPTEILKLFCSDFNNYYSFTDLKHLDWDSIYSANSIGLGAATTEIELYERLNAIVQSLRDGHVNVYAGQKIAFYQYSAGHPTNSRINIKTYVPDFRSPNAFVDIGKIQGTSISYIALRSFPSTTDPFTFINDLVKNQSQSSAVIIDIRMNGGGSDISAKYFASYFYDARRLYRKTAFKLPGKPGFTAWHMHYIDPAVESTFLKPVIVLTSKQTFSSAESFLLSMKVLPHVRVVGDTTGGGSGNPIFKELPNGWTFRLSNWIERTAQDQIYEGIGLFPDVAVWNSKADSINQRDRVLETAINLLK